MLVFFEKICYNVKNILIKEALVSKLRLNAAFPKGGKMIISPVSVVSSSSQNPRAFKGSNDTITSEPQPPISRRSDRNISIFGTLCLASSVGVVVTGATSCLVKGKVKPFAAGALAAFVTGVFSWPEKPQPEN